MNRMPLNKAFYLLLLLLCNALLFAQKNTITGKVIDENTKEPLAFVNLVYNSKNQGISSNIDGKFSIPPGSVVEFLKVSYIGYEPQTLAKEKLEQQITIALKPLTTTLNEVTILPGINPADRIMEATARNRKINNPEKLDSYSYTSYNKMVFTFSLDSLTKTNDSASLAKDSSYYKFKNFLDKQYLLIMESISERKFKSPDKINEKVIASKFSGLKEPYLVLLATQLQSFSFYSDFINVADKFYLSPVCNGNTSKYFFQLQDTLYSNAGDTIFVISFRPKRGKNFDGLKGVIQVNTNRYAIQNVKAEPFNEQEMLQIKIQQLYEFIDSTQWFPVQLNTDIKFKTLEAKEGDATTQMMGIGKTYIENIKLNPEIDNSEFRQAADLKVEDNAHKKDDAFWEANRTDSLNEKEKNTYHIIDSIGKAENLDLKIKVLESVMSGYIPVKWFNLDFSHLIEYNYYEGLRLGLSLVTNEKISKHVFFGGFYHYSFADWKSKFGGNLKINLSKNHESSFNAYYKDDVQEFGSFDFFEQRNLTSSEFFRDYLISHMDKIKQWHVSITHRFLKYFKCNFYMENTQRNITTSYLFQTPENRYINSFIYSQAGIRLKFIYKEQFFQTPKGMFSMGSKYPVIWLNVSKGINYFDGQFDYLKVETRLMQTFKTKRFGKTLINITAAQATGDLPLALLYEGMGTKRGFTLYSENTFSTMLLNEFYSNRFVSVCFKQDFGSLLFSTKKYKPELAVVTNFLIGKLDNTGNHFYYPIRVPDKGYFESGILFNNLLKQIFLGYGVGVFYRYGYYSFPEIKQNFAYKLTLTLDF